jgi:hypothetical protein
MWAKSYIQPTNKNNLESTATFPSITNKMVPSLSQSLSQLLMGRANKQISFMCKNPSSQYSCTIQLTKESEETSWQNLRNENKPVIVRNDIKPTDLLSGHGFNIS